MKKFEITLKVSFVLLALALIVTGNVNSLGLMIFLIVSFALGGVLIFNKDSSYKFKHTKTDFKLRRIEGILLAIFAVVAWLYLTGIL